MASKVTMPFFKDSVSSSAGIAVISFDLPSTSRWPSPKPCSLAQALTRCNGPCARPRSKERRSVLPSIATTSRWKTSAKDWAQALKQALYGASGVKRFRPRLSTWPRRSFGPGGTSFSFQPLRASEAALAARSPCWLARADQPSRLPPRATLSDTVRRLEDKLVGESRHRRSEGELAIGRGSSRHNLVFGRSRGSLTMMQSCASAAKLRGGGPILENGVKPWPASGGRHLGSSSETDDGLFARFRELVLPASSLRPRPPFTLLAGQGQLAPRPWSPCATAR